MADYSGLGALFSGMAQGAGTGAQLGFMARQLRLAERKQAAVEGAAKAEADRKATELKLNKFGKLADLFNDAPETLKPDIWRNTVAPMANEMFGADFDPNNYPKEGTQLMKDVGKVINGMKEGKFSTNDGLYMLGELRTKMVGAGLEKQATKVGDIISDLPGVKGAQGMDRVKAAKRMTELQKMWVQAKKGGGLEAALASYVTGRPDLMTGPKPVDLDSLKGAMLTEIETLNPYLPENRRVQVVTQQEYDYIKKDVTQKGGRSVTDEEMFRRFIIVD